MYHIQYMISEEWFDKSREVVYYRVIYSVHVVQIAIHTMYVRSNIYSKSMDQPGRVANPARGQLKSENEYFPVLVRA